MRGCWQCEEGLKSSFHLFQGFPGGSDGKVPVCNAGDLGSIPGLEEPLEKEMAATLVVLPGKSHGRRSLVGYYSPWGRKESDTKE